MPEPAQSPDPQRSLEEAENAYRNGDYAKARRVSRHLIAQSAPDEVKEEAKAILGRTGPDRVAIALIAVCLVFFIIVFAAYAGR
jgi:hypothetical protein